MRADTRCRGAQQVFLRKEEVCEKSYSDKAGKYQDQSGLTLPKVD
jgi:dCTP deaminase